MTSRTYFFGCWNAPGHYLHVPGGAKPCFDEERLVSSTKHKLDGALSPKRDKRTGRIVWRAQAETDAEYRIIEHVADELPQGQFLRHVLDNGFSALAWWDRTQGDHRGACNSVILVEGERSTKELLKALRESFPHVVANLARAGVELVEVFP